jgi:hypothetical protein
MQWMQHVNVMHALLMTRTDLPHIACLHKRVEVEMADGSDPAHKFTDLGREVMMLAGARDMNGAEKPLFHAIIPICSGPKQGSADITHRTDNTKAAALIHKMQKSVGGWWFGYWTKVKKYWLEMVKKLMESFDDDAALLARFAKFDPVTLVVITPFADVDEHLEGIESELGIDQGWCADFKGNSQKVDIKGHKEALAMTL